MRDRLPTSLLIVLGLLAFILPWCCVAPADAAILFDADPGTKAHDPITTNGSVEAKGGKRSPGGGVVLWITGTLDGANVTLEGNPGSGWAAADTCAAVAAVGVCRAAVGPVDLRVTVASAGASTSITVTGYEVQAVVASAAAAGGGGPVSFADVTSGTNPNALLVSGSLAQTGGGTVTANALATAALDALAEIADTLCADGESLVKSGGTWTCGTAGGAVDSVFARTGAVVAASGDYTCSQVTGCVTAAAAGTHAAQHQHGGADEIATATAAANAIPKAGAGATLASAWLPIVPTTLGGWGANVSALDCSGNANGGAITATAPGTFACSDDDSGAGAPAFSAITGGTNTAAAMVLGSGSSLAISGTGTNRATSIDADGDGTREVFVASGGLIDFDTDDNGTSGFRLRDSDGLMVYPNLWSLQALSSSQFNVRNNGIDKIRYGVTGAILVIISGPSLHDSSSLTSASVRPVSGQDGGMGGTASELALIHGTTQALGWTGTRLLDKLPRRALCQSAAPTSPVIGDVYCDTDSSELCFYDGSSWTGLKTGGTCA